MQLGGIGHDHSADTHQVTNCMHEHSHYKKSGGASAASSVTSMQSFALQEQQKEAEFSLSTWLQNTLAKGRGLLRGIWGSNETASAGEPGNRSGQEQLMASVGENAEAGNPKATATQGIHPNPYFAAVPENQSAVHPTPVQKLRNRIKGVAGQLAAKLSARSFPFQSKNFLQTKSEQRPKEDLRKRSKYRKDELEVDCILTDESYLLDSYDRKGEYSRLTTKK